MLPNNDTNLIPLYTYALAIFSKEQRLRSEVEKRFLETEENVVGFLVTNTGGDVQRSCALKSEIARLKALRDVRTVQQADEAASSSFAGENATMKAEIAAMEKQLTEQWRTRRAAIAEKYGEDVKSLDAPKLPFLRKNAGKVTAYNMFQKKLYLEQGHRKRYKHDRSQICSIMSEKASMWNSLSWEDKAFYQEMADEHNKQQPASELQKKRSAFVKLSGYLTRNLTMLREECGVEGICFVAPCNINNAIQPDQDGYGSDGGMHFWSLMQAGAIDLNGKNFSHHFKDQMLQYNKQLAASKNDTSTQQPSSSSSASASASATDSTAAPVTSISSGPNQVPSMTSQKPRTAQHDGVQKLRNIIAQKYRQAIFENYQVALPEGRKMAWQDKAMYRDIVMSGWPEGTERVNPSRLLQHERDEIERRLVSGELKFVKAPQQQRQHD
ncbi:hypothetical protein BDB00DRAFT_880591 [Zychaea mexicana]|uniref:uncharacterized protein n=1 Tax=Zychaea mexicana TaxID=64656 RepID=UPI0022FEAAC0|nr:uncharacterized protein BDB00DRAFT_880591 [Zychaea mexicana]KAI9467424.1 hypothetical protein BDB00DRAFT_880591 [Zychaea mexicana]